MWISETVGPIFLLFFHPGGVITSTWYTTDTRDRPVALKAYNRMTVNKRSNISLKNKTN